MFGFLKWTCNKHCWILSKLPRRITCLSGRTISVILRDFVFIQWLWVFELLCLSVSVFSQEELCWEQALWLINAEESVFVSTLVLVILAPKEARFPRLRQFSLKRRLVKGDVIKTYSGIWECLWKLNDPFFFLTFHKPQQGNAPWTRGIIDLSPMINSLHNF